MTGSTTIVSGVAYALGQRTPISAIPALASDDAAQAFLRERGFASFARSDQEPWQLAAAAVERALARSGIGPADIDEVLYATTTPTRPADAQGDRAGDSDEGIGAFAHATGLLRTPITGICFGECANCSMALEVGAMFLDTARAARVLVVSTDVARTRQDRLPLGATSVCGDGAVACVMSHEPLGSGKSFELCGYAKKFHHAGRAGLAPNPGQVFRELCMGVRSCKDAILPTFGDSAVKRWIPNNSNLEVVTAMASVVGLRGKDFYFDNLALNGHVFSADQLINLIDWAETASPGDCSVGLATGVSVCVAMGWRIL